MHQIQFYDRIDVSLRFFVSGRSKTTQIGSAALMPAPECDRILDELPRYQSTLIDIDLCLSDFFGMVKFKIPSSYDAEIWSVCT